MNNFNSPEIKGHRILIIGYGREGVSVHKFLSRNYNQIKISIADQKDNLDIKYPFDKTYFGKEYLSALNEFSTIIRSPGIPISEPKINSYLLEGGWVTSSTNIFLSKFGSQVIGITGSKGKSTTATLIYEILKTKYKDSILVGNIGRPALDFVHEINPKTKIIMELSSHQLVDCRYSPASALILRLFPEHLDYYSNYDSYIKAKLNICREVTNKNKLFINRDDTELVRRVENTTAQKIFFSTKYFDQSRVWEENGMIRFGEKGRDSVLIPLAKLGLKGSGNLENIIAAVNVAIVEEISADKIGSVLSGFTGLPHRLEYVGNFKGIDFFNDSLSTAPEATINACEALGDSVQTLFIGGYNRELEQTKLIKYLISHPNIHNLLLFPDTGTLIGNILEKNPSIKSRKLFYIDDLDEAVKIAYSQTDKGRICLLSPGAASFNKFTDYAQRGEQFKKLVKEYGQN